MLSIGSFTCARLLCHLPDVVEGALCTVFAGCVTGTRAVILVTDFGAGNLKYVVSSSLQQSPERLPSQHHFPLEHCSMASAPLENRISHMALHLLGQTVAYNAV